MVRADVKVKVQQEQAYAERWLRVLAEPDRLQRAGRDLQLIGYLRQPQASSLQIVYQLLPLDAERIHDSTVPCSWYPWVCMA
jgi:hypothetical protein